MSDSKAYFRWAHYHAAEAACACDCLARGEAFWAGRKLGRREQRSDMERLVSLLQALLKVLTESEPVSGDALRTSAYFQVVPLLQGLVNDLNEDRVDSEFESLEPSTYWSTT